MDSHIIFSNLHISSTRFDKPQALQMISNIKYHIAFHMHSE
ncbi:poly-gamma-glutamate hydrolase family protein [Halobacillus andaensis]